MAYGQSSIDSYRKNAVNTASPLQLVVMLYDGAIRFMTAARHAMLQRNIYEQNENCKRAQNIVTELQSTLDMVRGGEVAQNLSALYTYVFDQLIEANVNDNVDSLDQAVKVMENLRSGWVELDNQLRNPVAPGVESAA